MRVQIVTYNLNGISEGDYLDVANQLAARFSALPGLQAKLWLEHPESNTYGGVYFWDDEESMQRFVRSDLFEGTNPEFANVVSEDFNVLQNLTRLTQPVLEVLPDDAVGYRPPPLPGGPPGQAPGPSVPVEKATAKKARAKKGAAAKAPLKKVAVKKVPAKVPVKKVSAKKVTASKVTAKKPGRPRKV